MKQLICLTFFCFILLSGCRDNDPEPEAADPLLRAWKVSRVTLDDVDVTAYYSNMTLTITESAYRVEHAVPPVWPETGTYTVNGKQMRRDDDLDIEIVTVSDTALTLRFQYQGLPGRGRVNEVSGQYTFEWVIK